jgi:hypothetical protein
LGEVLQRESVALGKLLRATPTEPTAAADHALRWPSAS